MQDRPGSSVVTAAWFECMSFVIPSGGRLGLV